MEGANACKYCLNNVESSLIEYVRCNNCEEIVHVKCLQKGAVPSGLTGDVFFKFTCSDCSPSQNEEFVRDKMPWLQAIVLVLYHMQCRNPGLARKGFFHWKIHIATFINKHWDLLFSKDFKRKKMWMGTISGTLSHYSPLIFSSGTSVFTDQGWWTLTYPKLPPKVIVDVNSEYLIRRTKHKDITEYNLFEDIAKEKNIPEDYLNRAAINDIKLQLLADQNGKLESSIVPMERKTKKNLLPSLDQFGEGPPKKSSKSNKVDAVFKTEVISKEEKEILIEKPVNKFLDPFCHYNTSLINLAHSLSVKLSVKLTGNVREELILSPYSGLYLKPYIRRDNTCFPTWLQLMAEILIKTNSKDGNYRLPPRSTLDYTYVQPSHIPAINSLCNQFFWPGIDLTECLQYPDFSCVVLYKKLIVGFAFLVPDVKINENYLSFIFTRPSWRNAGIGKFMIYHLIQTSLGKDITLHVSENNPALLLYQKFGFKVENVVLDFYDKYLRRDTKESKHAFFCRLER